MSLAILFVAAAAAADPPPPVPLAPRDAAIDLVAPRDPRVGRWLGFGLHMGLAGVSGVSVGARFLGLVNPVVTVSPFGTLDLTMRVNLLHTRWTPQVGVGYTVGYRAEPFFGAGTPACTVPHGDAGVEFTPGRAFTFDAGLSLGVSRCGEEATVLPIPYVGTSWYLGRR